MDERTLRILEFPKIVARVGELCAFPVSRDLVLALRPSPIVGEVVGRQRLTSEAKALIALDPSLSVGGARDVREALQAAAIGRQLVPSQLLDVLQTVRAARDLRGRFGRLHEARDRYPAMTDLAWSIGHFAGLEADIGRSLNDAGEVVDGASPDLGRLRAETRVAQQRLLDRLNGLLHKYATAVQEAIITQREGRYVIPVRVSERAHVPGLVHDSSASGQTLFVEPFEAVELANRWRTLQAEERREVERILNELSQAVGDQASVLRATLEVLGRIDAALAMARFSLELAGVEPRVLAVTAAAGQTPQRAIDLRAARHPLLGPGAVPIDVWLGQDARVLVITGPNTGGKTVALKTVGLFILMAQAGLHLPVAEGSSLSVFPRVFADIGDEQSIEQSLSTFSSHLSNIVAMLREVDGDSLVLLDELGAGTDPVEGAALARAIIAELLARGPLVVATSHYAELKTYAYSTPSVANAAVEFNVETLSPTYRLTIGVPGRSNALAIAARLGLAPAIIEAARSLLSHEHVSMEDLLSEVRSDLDRAGLERRQAEQERREAERERQHLAAERAALEAGKAAAVREAVAAFEREIEAVREDLRGLERERTSVAVSREWLAEAQARAGQVAADFRAAEERRNRDRQRHAPTRGLRAGERVQVHSLGQIGEVVEATEQMAVVQLGAMRLRLPTSDLSRLGTAAATAASPAPRRASDGNGGVRLPLPPSAPVEIDLRGMRAHEVEALLDRVIHDASFGNLPYLRIIHGKGTGALRQVVRDALRASALVDSFETAPQNQGGDGVTIATFRAG